MTGVDIPADLNTEDQTRLTWTFLEEAADPSKPRATHGPDVSE